MKLTGDQASSNEEFYRRYDPLPGIKVLLLPHLAHRRFYFNRWMVWMSSASSSAASLPVITACRAKVVDSRVR